MGKLLVIFTLFAMVVSTTASIAHAHMDVGSTSGVHISVDVDNDSNPTGDSEPVSNNDCDMGCCGSCFHHHAMPNLNQDSNPFMSAKDKLILSNTDHYLSDLIYGLKRPPKA